MNINTRRIYLGPLYDLELKIFTEQDAYDYCELNDINPDNITVLDLSGNKLTNISGIKLFKNLKELHIDSNKLKNISNIKYLNSLEYLNINDNELTDITVLKDLNNLKILWLDNNKLTDISVLKNLNNLKTLGIENNKITDISVIQNFKNLGVLEIVNLKLDSDQIKYIQSLKNLKELYCYKGFKDMAVLDQLNKNIEISYIN